MARRLTVLVALVAQGMALMLPVCFVRCVAPNGQECVELTGQNCRRCECQPAESMPQACAVETCNHHHENEDQAEHDAPIGWQVGCEHCSCQHSPLEPAPQVQSKPLLSESRTHSLDFAAISAASNFDAVIRGQENARLQRSLLRPHESPQLSVLATVVLRV